MELEYDGSQAEGSFAFRAEQEGATEVCYPFLMIIFIPADSILQDYYIFCDSSASRQRLVEDLRAVIAKV